MKRAYYSSFTRSRQKRGALLFSVMIGHMATTHATDICKALAIEKPKIGNVKFIAVDGHGGSGKSGLAGYLAQKLHAEIIRTDDFASWDNPFSGMSAQENRVKK